MSESASTFCPRYHHAVELVGRRWNGAILRAMMGGAARFGEIAAAIPDLSDRMLSERLKELEAEGILTRSVFPETPVRIEYGLTPKGRALAPVVEALTTWAEEWIATDVPRERAERAAACPTVADPIGR
jgi:DNA-binding HxlR family transcriptional regulator